MDQTRMGGLIRRMRRKMGLTQLALANRLGVSDKAVSKWERGCGAPDISLLPLLSDALQVDMASLLRGDLEENDMTNGNMKKIRCYFCPACANLVFTLADADIHCCGQKLPPLTPRRADEAHRLFLTYSDGEWYVTGAHEMTRAHHVSFVAFLTGGTMTVRKLYPEWDLETRLPYTPHGLLLWLCNRDGLFYQAV